MKQLSFAQLSELSAQAHASSRRRMNHNLHKELSDPIQRLAVAMPPDTYVRPHRHRDTWELLTPLRGRFVVLNFDADGRVSDRIVLGDEAAIVETGTAAWHAVLSLDGDAVIFEVKHGPYAPLGDEDFAPWSPPPDTEESRRLLKWYAGARIGDRWRP